MGKLKNIWILINEGLVIFNRTSEVKMNNQLFGGFISALNMLASQLNKEGLSNFDIGTIRYVIAKHQNLIFIGTCDVSVKLHRAKKDLTKIVERFFINYPSSMLEHWDGDTSQFEPFGQKISDCVVKEAKNTIEISSLRKSLSDLKEIQKSKEIQLENMLIKLIRGDFE